LALLSVSTGITDNRNTEIIRGDLKEGDQVIIGEALTSNAQGSSSPLRMRF